MKKLNKTVIGLILLIIIIVLLSSCSYMPVTNKGKSYALIIGINDYQNVNVQDLSWCVNDANGMESALIKQGWDQSQITKLLDADATKVNIINELNNIINKATSNDYILVYYSGHGTQVPDTNGDEADGYDEAIVPVDFDGNISSLIIDDQLGEIFSKSKTQKGVFIFDSCYSGGFINKSLINDNLKSDNINPGDFHKQKSSERQHQMIWIFTTSLY